MIFYVIIHIKAVKSLEKPQYQNPDKTRLLDLGNNFLCAHKRDSINQSLLESYYCDFGFVNISSVRYKTIIR